MASESQEALQVTNTKDLLEGMGVAGKLKTRGEVMSTLLDKAKEFAASIMPRVSELSSQPEFSQSATASALIETWMSQINEPTSAKGMAELARLTTIHNALHGTGSRLQGEQKLKHSKDGLNIKVDTPTLLTEVVQTRLPIESITESANILNPNLLKTAAVRLRAIYEKADTELGSLNQPSMSDAKLVSNLQIEASGAILPPEIISIELQNMMHPKDLGKTLLLILQARESIRTTMADVLKPVLQDSLRTRFKNPDLTLEHSSTPPNSEAYLIKYGKILRAAQPPMPQILSENMGLDQVESIIARAKLRMNSSENTSSKKKQSADRAPIFQTA